MSSYDKYLDHFPAGMKVRVGIPVPGGQVFTDWAIIHDIDEDLIELQLSRDSLPAGVRLLLGTILDLRGGKDDNGYSCRAIIVSEGYQRTILLRLIGEIVSDELREYYRIDAFLPLKYYLADGSSEVQLKKAWIAKREARHTEELERKQHQNRPWQRMVIANEEELPEETLAQQEDDTDSGEGIDDYADSLHDHSWDDVIPLAANISGGGIKLLMHHKFAIDELMPLEIYLPSEPTPRVIDAVGKVVFAAENLSAAKQLHQNSYNTGIQFLYIDERDRDAIVSYISNVQLKRIRALRDKYLLRSLDREATHPLSKTPPINLLRQAILTLLVTILIVMIALYFKNYSQNRPKNEIELIFEKGFKEYLKKIGREPSP